MEVSKLSFTEETRLKLQNPTLTRKRRNELRTELIIDYIRNKPQGTPISIKELCSAARYPSNKYKTGYGHIQKMIQRGLISQERTGPGRRAKGIYTVIGDAKKIVQSTTPTKPVIVKPKTIEPTNTQHIVEAAKKFAWEHNSDSLRAFIATLQ